MIDNISAKRGYLVAPQSISTFSATPGLPNHMELPGTPTHGTLGQASSRAGCSLGTLPAPSFQTEAKGLQT